MHKATVGKTRRGRFAAYSLLVVAALALSLPFMPLALAEVAPAANGAAPASSRLVPHTDVNPYGANFFLHLEAENWKIERTLKMASEAGLGWVKQQFPWESLEKAPGKFNDDRYQISTWDKFDFIVDTAAKYGLQVIARLDRPPDWAREPGTTPMSPPKDYAAYGRFVYQVAKHYGGKVRYYQIWNEPNLTEEWGGKPVDAKAYAELLKVAYEEIKRANPDAYVLSAPLAQTTERNQAHMNEVDFLDQMYAAGAKPYFDLLFANAYGFSLPPEDPPNPGVLNFSRVLLQRQVMERHGDGAKPVWFNEFGWNAPPEEIPAEAIKWGRVSEQQQAEYTVRAVAMARRDWAWAGVFNIWFFRHDGRSILPADAQFYFRMVDVGFTPRLLYREVKEAATPLRVAAAGHYQETNPALTRLQGWRHAFDAAAEGGGVLVPDTPGDKVAITFSGSSISIVARTGPDGGRAYVALDGNGVEGLPRDAGGSPYVDFYSEAASAKTAIVLATNLRPGNHRVELTFAAERHPSAKGHVVVLDAFEVGKTGQFPWVETAAGTVMAVVVLGLVVWRRRRSGGPRANV